MITLGPYNSLIKFVVICFTICLLVGCNEKGKEKDISDGLVYQACLIDVLRLSGRKDPERKDTIRETLFVDKPMTNIGLSNDYLLEPAIKKLISEDPAWKSFIEQIDPQIVLSDSILQRPGFTVNPNSIHLENIDVRPITVDWTNQRPRDFWRSHRTQFPNSLGIVNLTQIIYSADKRKGMLESIGWGTG